MGARALVPAMPKSAADEAQFIANNMTATGRLDAAKRPKSAIIVQSARRS